MERFDCWGLCIACSSSTVSVLSLVQTVKPVEKIHLEFDAKSRKVSPSTRQLLDTLRSLSKVRVEPPDLVFLKPWFQISTRASLFKQEVNETSSSSEPGYSVYDFLMVVRCACSSWGTPKTKSPLNLFSPLFQATAPQALFGFKALAISGGQRPEGYEGALYSSPEDSMPNSQLTVSQVGENANWKMCIDSAMSATSETKVKTPPPGRNSPLAWISCRNIFALLCQAGCTQLLLFQMKPLELQLPA